MAGFHPDQLRDNFGRWSSGIARSVKNGISDHITAKKAAIGVIHSGLAAYGAVATGIVAAGAIHSAVKDLSNIASPAKAATPHNTVRSTPPQPQHPDKPKAANTKTISRAGRQYQDSRLDIYDRVSEGEYGTGLANKLNKAIRKDVDVETRKFFDKVKRQQEIEATSKKIFDKMTRR